MNKKIIKLKINDAFIVLHVYTTEKYVYYVAQATPNINIVFTTDFDSDSKFHLYESNLYGILSIPNSSFWTLLLK